jgi:hypothetical protein
MLNEFLDLERWLQWFAGLEREFVFLLALPFVVAIIGLWSALAGDEQAEEEERRPEEGSARASAPERRQRIRRREDLGRIAPHER